MPSGSTLAVFALTALALAVIPGPAVVYIVSQSVSQGRLAGVVSALGIAGGACVHVAAAALGLSALLVSSAAAYDVVRFAGAAYLVYLGVRRLLGRDGFDATREVRLRAHRRIFGRGVVVNVLNPKTALFFYSFLPQFVDPARGHVAAQVVLFGLMWVVIALSSDTVWALLAGTAAGWLRGNARAVRAERYASGGILVGLGVTAAVAGHRAR